MFACGNTRRSIFRRAQTGARAGQKEKPEEKARKVTKKKTKITAQEKEIAKAAREWDKQQEKEREEKKREREGERQAAAEVEEEADAGDTQRSSSVGPGQLTLDTMLPVHAKRARELEASTTTNGKPYLPLPVKNAISSLQRRRIELACAHDV